MNTVSYGHGCAAGARVVACGQGTCARVRRGQAVCGCGAQGHASPLRTHRPFQPAPGAGRCPHCTRRAGRRGRAGRARAQGAEGGACRDRHTHWVKCGTVCVAGSPVSGWEGGRTCWWWWWGGGLHHPCALWQRNIKRRIPPRAWVLTGNLCGVSGRRFVRRRPWRGASGCLRPCAPRLRTRGSRGRTATTPRSGRSGNRCLPTVGP
jgi:hypothetical protein